MGGELAIPEPGEDFAQSMAQLFQIWNPPTE
jgi:hypothetical protein